MSTETQPSIKIGGVQITDPRKIEALALKARIKLEAALPEVSHEVGYQEALGKKISCKRSLHSEKDFNKAIDLITNFEHDEVTDFANGFKGGDADFTDGIRSLLRNNEYFKNLVLAQRTTVKDGVPFEKAGDNLIEDPLPKEFDDRGGGVDTQDKPNQNFSESFNEPLTFSEYIQYVAKDILHAYKAETKKLQTTLETLLALRNDNENMTNDLYKILGPKEDSDSQKRSVEKGLKSFIRRETFRLLSPMLNPSAKTGWSKTLEHVMTSDDLYGACEKLNPLLRRLASCDLSRENEKAAELVLRFIEENIPKKTIQNNEDIQSLMDCLDEKIETNKHLNSLPGKLELRADKFTVIYTLQEHETITPECLEKMKNHAQGQYIEFKLEEKNGKINLLGKLKEKLSKDFNEIYIQVIKNKGNIQKQTTEFYRFAVQTKSKKTENDWTSFWDNPIMNILKKPVAGWIAAGVGALFTLMGIASKEDKTFPFFGAMVSFIASLPSLIANFGEEKPANESPKDQQSPKPKARKQAAEAAAS